MGTAVVLKCNTSLRSHKYGPQQKMLAHQHLSAPFHMRLTVAPNCQAPCSHCNVLLGQAATSWPSFN
jgi:hypothetical protein